VDSYKQHLVLNKAHAFGAVDRYKLPIKHLALNKAHALEVVDGYNSRKNLKMGHHPE